MLNARTFRSLPSAGADGTLVRVDACGFCRWHLDVMHLTVSFPICRGVMR